MEIGGIDIQLPWIPTPDQMLFRLREKWPDVVAVPIEGAEEILYYEDTFARQEWAEHGLTETNANQLVHVLWNIGGQCWIVVASEFSDITTHLTGWERPVELGDQFHIYDPEGFVRTVTVDKVTSRSFHTSDGITWSLRGRTPWSFSLPLVAKWADAPPEKSD